MICPILYFNISVTSVSSVAKYLVLIRVNSWLQTCFSTFVESPLQIHPFYAKQTQISPILRQKSRFRQKTNPKQTQTKPNGYLPKMNANPLLTRYYEKLRLSGRNENKPKSNPNFWADSLTENVFSVNSVFSVA